MVNRVIGSHQHFEPIQWHRAIMLAENVRGRWLESYRVYRRLYEIVATAIVVNVEQVTIVVF